MGIVSVAVAYAVPPASVGRSPAGAAQGRIGGELPTLRAIDWAGRVRSFHATVAGDVRRELAGERAVRSGPPEAAFDLAGTEQAVLADHDARIAFLTGRLEQARADGARAALQIRDLRDRLRRAQAARQVALARATPAGERAVEVAADFPAAVAPPPWRVKDAAPTRRPVADVRSGRFASRSAVRPLAADGEGAHALRHARRLLAHARRALEGGAPTRSGEQLADLVQWEGSASWTLADLPGSFT